jgi:hypothetical protein
MAVVRSVWSADTLPSMRRALASLVSLSLASCGGSLSSVDSSMYDRCRRFTETFHASEREYSSLPDSSHRRQFLLDNGCPPSVVGEAPATTVSHTSTPAATGLPAEGRIEDRTDGDGGALRVARIPLRTDLEFIVTRGTGDGSRIAFALTSASPRLADCHELEILAHDHAVPVPAPAYSTRPFGGSVIEYLSVPVGGEVLATIAAGPSVRGHVCNLWWEIPHESLATLRALVGR